MNCLFLHFIFERSSMFYPFLTFYPFLSVLPVPPCSTRSLAFYPSLHVLPVPPCFIRPLQSALMSPSSFEQKYVHSFYATNHHAFSSTRHKPWPSVTDFLTRNQGKLILDAGCGNGRHLCPTSVGVDYTRAFLHECVRTANCQALTLMACDVSCLPFRDESFDAVLSCAVVHHLENARQGVEQLYRVLRSGGSCFIIVWALRAVHKHGGNDDTQGRRKFVKIKDNEYLVDWQAKGQMRFYHLYEKDELVELVRSVGFRVVECKEEDESINVEVVKD